jgi:hypothetical protein
MDMYKYETFRAESDEFNDKFTEYLNLRASENWRVKHCNYCHGSTDGKMYASCMLEKEG